MQNQLVTYLEEQFKANLFELIDETIKVNQNKPDDEETI